MKNRIIGVYTLLIGLSVIGMWAVILLQETPAEGTTELSFHLFSEFLMAFTCLVSGILLLKNKPYGKLLNFAALGMVIYSTLNAAGYYGNKDEPLMMIVFIALSLITAAAIVWHFRK